MEFKAIEPCSEDKPRVCELSMHLESNHALCISGFISQNGTSLSILSILAYHDYIVLLTLFSPSFASSFSPHAPLLPLPLINS